MKNYTGIACLVQLILAFTLSACNDQPKAISTSSGSANSSSSSSTSNSAYLDAKSTKVIFNKKFFYNNYSPNAYGCSGDAKSYFDMQSDREIPVKPTWLKNVAVDITNANALYGVSNASSCALTGLGAPAATNCAVFDDLQPLSGAQSRSVLIGGYGCNTASNSCSTTNGLSDIWNLSMPEDPESLSFGIQPVAIDQDAASTKNGFVFGSGDYSEIHDQVVVYGGVTQTVSTGNLTTDTTITKIKFNPNGTVASSTTQTPSTVRNYGNWSQATVTPAAPTAIAGVTFTNALRRDPTMKSWCNGADATYCKGTTTAATAKNKNEHQDYFLLLGGWDVASATMSKTIYAYKANAYSNDYDAANGVGSPGGPADGANGDWTLLSNSGAGSILKEVAVSYSGTSTVAPYTIDTTSLTWTTGTAAKAYHRTVYDPGMNRFYIYGGLTGDATTSGGTAASSELWFYDPPALGRRPTATCFMTNTPVDATVLPRTTNLFTTTTGLNVNQSYFSNKMVFPPGGCLQKITATTTHATARFEHSMAFDRDQKAMLVFGGCTQAPSTIAVAGVNTGDPTVNCSSSTLLNDTWLYIPPTTQELVAYTYDGGTGTHPYSSTSTTRFPNIFSTDFWLLHFPYFSDNVATNSILTQPSIADSLGYWVQLSPTSYPTKRVSSSMVYDRAHHKFYLQGGYGCTDSSCSNVTMLNDLWEFTPPAVSTACSKSTLTCSSSGTWTQLKSHNKEDTTIPTARKGALMVYAMPMFSHGDDYYTVQDTSCAGAGPISTSDPSISKQYVGAIYVHLDRSYFGDKENLLLNIKMLPFDNNTRLPGIYDGGTTYTTTDDADYGSLNDKVIIRVQALSSPLKAESQILAAIQPRFHEYIAGTPRIADTLMYVGGASGQVSEKQVLIPITLDSSIDLIKIERVQGSLKFYEMSVSKF